MLILGSRLIGVSVMGLQTGTQLAKTKSPVIDPGNLKIIAYELDGPMLTEHPSFIRIDDVRELSNVGLIIDSSDEFIGQDDVIAVNEVHKLNFKLISLNVIDQSKHKLGKVVDYSLDTDSFIVQQLNVKQGVIKSLSEPELLIHRSQIVEINDTSIIVKSAAKKLEPITEPQRLTYMNPFRPSNPQANNTAANRPQDAC